MYSEQSGKSRAFRIRLDYYKTTSWLDRLRWILALLGLLLSGGYALFILAGVYMTPSASSSASSNASAAFIPSEWRKAASLHLSTGRISEAHSHFEADCILCHVPAESTASWAQSSFGRQNKIELGTKCQACHQSTQSHLARVDDESCKLVDQDCASCHTEHVGFDANLIRVASSTCTQCHANLNDACREPGLDISNEIASFASGHKSFRSLENDTGRIKFSHYQHLQPGQVKQGHRGGFELAMLSPSWRQQTNYRSGPDGLIQLDCKDCHSIQSPQNNSIATESAAKQASATDGELAHFYAPIKFDRHCAACHQLTFAGQSAEMLPLPHAAKREEFEVVLSARLVGGRLSGRLLSRANQASGIEDVSETLLRDEIDAAVDRIAEGCTKCHIDQDLMDTSSTMPMLPTRWLKRGLFEHGSHADIACADCHVVPPQEDPLISQVVMIKGPESCTPCHRRSEVLAGKSSKTESTHVGEPIASDDCTLCHRYHWSRL